MHDSTFQIEQNITAGNPDPEMAHGFGTGVMNPLQFLCGPESCLIKMCRCQWITGCSLLNHVHRLQSLGTRLLLTPILGPSLHGTHFAVTLLIYTCFGDVHPFPNDSSASLNSHVCPKTGRQRNELRPRITCCSLIVRQGSTRRQHLLSPCNAVCCVGCRPCICRLWNCALLEDSSNCASIAILSPVTCKLWARLLGNNRRRRWRKVKHLSFDMVD